MLVDEACHDVLKKYVDTKGTSNYSGSDHNSIYAEFTLQYSEGSRRLKREIFNFQNKEC